MTSDERALQYLANANPVRELRVLALPSLESVCLTPWERRRRRRAPDSRAPEKPLLRGWPRWSYAAATAAAGLATALAIALPVLLLRGGESTVATVTTAAAPTTAVVATTAPVFSGIVVVVPDGCEGCEELTETLIAQARGEVAIQVVAAPEADQRPAVRVVALDGSVVAEWKGVEATVHPADRATVENADAIIRTACEALGGCSPETTSTTMTTLSALPATTVSGTIAFAMVVDQGDPPGSNHPQRTGYSWSSSDIYIVRSDGSGLTQLTDDVGREAHPSWSPDGNRVAYEAGPTWGFMKSSSIWVMNADGSEKVQLTGMDGSTMPVWSPDGTQIAYVRYFPGARGYDIYVMDGDGSEQRCVVSLDGDETNPGWTPEGRIVFLDADGLSAVYPDGSGLATLGLDSAGLGVSRGVTQFSNYLLISSGFALSPDGKTVAYYNLETRQMVAAAVDAAGPPHALLESARQPLATSDPGIAFGWTPDSQALALASDGSQGRWGSRIVVINA
ncbi:MAG: TolB protein, partial [Gemmatimonadetes bacterium]|nr:TolB protein [Gemmatimonadota bacterium]